MKWHLLRLETVEEAGLEYSGPKNQKKKKNYLNWAWFVILGKPGKIKESE